MGLLRFEILHWNVQYFKEEGGGNHSFSEFERNLKKKSSLKGHFTGEGVLTYTNRLCLKMNCCCFVPPASICMVHCFIFNLL